MGMKIAVLVLAVLSAACGCPAAASGVDTKEMWTAERDAACAAVEGCDAEYMAQIPVYRASMQDAQDMCAGWGCFCVQPGCAGVIVFTEPDRAGYYERDTILHEYIHAAFYTVDHDTEKHPPEFLQAFIRAFEARNAKQ